MNSKRKVEVCLILNISLLIIITSFISICADESKYFRFGPHNDFILISIKINNISKYIGLLTIIGFMNCIKVLVAELGEPVLVFNVYNPDKKIIDDFSKFQLLLYANSMFFVSNVRRVFEVMITITQIDIAIFSVIFFIIKLINIKFIKKSDEPLKPVVIDTLIVFISVIMSLFIMDQFSLLKRGENKIQAFVSNPEF